MPKQLNEFAPDMQEQPPMDAAAPAQPPMDAGMGAETPMPTPDGGHDDEGAMAKADLYKLANYSLKLFKQMHDGDQLEAWVQAKITKAADYIASVYHYLEYEMKFSEYGSKLENSDVYSESEKLELKNKLTEAREMLKTLKLQQAEKLDEGKKPKKADKDYDGDGKVESGKDEYLGSKIAAAKKAGKMEESMGGGMAPCEACGGTGHVAMPEKQWSEEAKSKAAAYNRKAKAYAAATKRIDANKNGIPDDEEAGTEPKDKAPAKKAAPKAKKEESSSQGVYEAKKKAKPDFLDMDKDGDKKEPMKKAVKDKKLDERDLGKHNNGKTTGFKAVAKKAAKEYGSKAAGERVAGAIKAKMAKSGKLEEGIMDDVTSTLGNAGNAIGNAASSVGTALGFDTEANLAAKSPQLKALLDMRKKYPEGSDEARQLDARIQAQKDRVSTGAGEIGGAGGMPVPVEAPDVFKQKNPNFKYEALAESADLARMKALMTRLNG